MQTPKTQAGVTEKGHLGWRDHVASLAFSTHGQVDWHVVAGHVMQGNGAV